MVDREPAPVVAREHNRLLGWNDAKTRLVEAVQELSLARDLPGIMAVVRRAARELTGADGATFVLRDKECCYYADEDAIEPLWKGQRFPINSCISGWSMLNSQPAVIEDIYADARIPAAAYRPTFVKSLVMVPIRTGAPIGAIGNYWATRRQPAPEEVELLQALANTTAVAMETVQVYAELEQRVKERTAQLEAANRELEAFAYAVSHDLGAPLRSVSSFAALLKDSPDLSPAQSGMFLEKIQTAAERMRRLMDDLLRLSRISSGELQRQRIDLSLLARGILARIASETPDRQVQIQVQERVVAQGDPGLLRIVLENLLSNAWKYSLRAVPSRIEFGCSGVNGIPAFFVRDNGVGFDMKQAGHLFRPFHRLHSAADFPGTGIGLATAQRIVQRHDGRMWVQAAPGKGATFYFTLNKS